MKVVKLFYFRILLLFFIGLEAIAQTRDPMDMAVSIHNRITGVPGRPEVLAAMRDQIAAGNVPRAVEMAMERPQFYDVSLQQFFVRWTNVDRRKNEPLNDAVATAIGMVRDNIRFDEFLYGDHYYLASGTEQLRCTKVGLTDGGTCTVEGSPCDSSAMPLAPGAPAPSPVLSFCERQNSLLGKRVRRQPNAATMDIEDLDLAWYNMSTERRTEFGNPDGEGWGVIRRWARNSNDHYSDLQARVYPRLTSQSRNYSLSDPQVLRRFSLGDFVHRTNQYSPLPVLNPPAAPSPAPLGFQFIPRRAPAADLAGVFSTRAWAAAFYDAGTNRRAYKYTLKNFLCRDLDKVMDTGLPDDRVRQDVERRPGGNRNIFSTYCIGCHAHMDAFSGAFAKHDFGGAALEISTGVRPKYLQNSDIFPSGFRTTSASWVNYLAEGSGRDLGWRDAPGASHRSGLGMQSFARVIAASQGFSECMAEQVFEHFCLRSPMDGDRAGIRAMGQVFEDSGYSFRELVKQSVTQLCPGY